MRLFGQLRPVIGVVHLLPLPGSPRARDLEEVRRRALADAKALRGVHAMIVENYGDAPFFPDRVEPHVVACMTAIACALPRPLGVNVLRNDARAALAVALAAGADFIRVNVHTGVMHTDQGTIEGRAFETLRMRAALGAKALVFADVLVKHASGGGDPASAARDAAYRGLADALLVTGARTGAPPDPERLRLVKRAVPDRPVLAASGLAPENLPLFAEADGFIVGTALKKGGRTGNPVDPRRVREFLRAWKGLEKR
ncbi:MAG: BtpA/SgcQ family protein [Planctomycetes bacterium]|nr:BtpA/SgcQ family protein [Planctomycetota bacterium]